MLAGVVVVDATVLGVGVVVSAVVIGGGTIFKKNFKTVNHFCTFCNIIVISNNKVNACIIPMQPTEWMKNGVVKKRELCSLSEVILPRQRHHNAINQTHIYTDKHKENIAELVKCYTKINGRKGKQTEARGEEQ